MLRSIWFWLMRVFCPGEALRYVEHLRSERDAAGEAYRRVYSENVALRERIAQLRRSVQEGGRN